MATATTIDAEVREELGKSTARAMRREGRIPGVVYNKDTAPVHITLDAKDITLRSNKASFFSRVLELKAANKTYKVLPKVLERHPVTDNPLHVDFLHLDENTATKVLVQVKVINKGKSPGIKRGGTLNTIRREVELLARPADIPEFLIVDLDGRQIGDSIHISEIDLPEGVTPTITDRDFTVAAIVGRKGDKAGSAESEEGDEEEGAEGEEAAASEE